MVDALKDRYMNAKEQIEIEIAARLIEERAYSRSMEARRKLIEEELKYLNAPTTIREVTWATFAITVVLLTSYLIVLIAGK